MSLGTGSPLVNEKEAGGFLAKGGKGLPNSVMRGGAQLSESMAGGDIVSDKALGYHPHCAMFEVLITHPWWLPLLYTPLP
jgi:hypothetical protein